MFQPVLPASGLTGWKLLESTMAAQTRAFEASPRMQRDTAYFEDRINTITTAGELVSDRRLLRVALGAFGLGDDINNRHFVQQVLESRADDGRSLANSLSDSRYRQLNRAFGFGDPATGPRTGTPGFGAEITAQFRARSFEIAVGRQDDSLRLALNAQRELATIAGSAASESEAWFRVLGTPPLREVFETAFGLPDGFGRLDIDRQQREFRALARERFGVTSFSDFSGSGARDKVVETYLLRDQVSARALQTPQAIALSLLRA
ncbi:DUF1217 domain-containing protein [Roseovarius salis]|uniref:DUF1217 domain-containing protein n=1 Tax=Roseovarius salis TaxID=3376063 RepID=UPI0037C575F7